MNPIMMIYPPMFSGSPKGGYAPFRRHLIPLDQIDSTKEVLVEMSAEDGLFLTILGIEANPTVLVRQWPSTLSPINGGIAGNDEAGNYTDTRKIVILKYMAYSKFLPRLKV